MQRLLAVVSNNRAATLLEISKLDDKGVLALGNMIASTWTGGKSIASADQGRQFMLLAAEKELHVAVLGVCDPRRWPDINAKGEARLGKIRAQLPRSQTAPDRRAPSRTDNARRDVLAVAATSSNC